MNVRGFIRVCERKKSPALLLERRKDRKVYVTFDSFPPRVGKQEKIQY